ncbi:hypothetical protein BDV93DRAFT_554100 [Ceratobasidium sp. AG-I]|nr:hypothetical protein BDV93DRAFT_554100 [Ceratobasidium sp. AG-I]
MKEQQPDLIPHLALNGLELPSKATLEQVRMLIINAAQDTWLSVRAHGSTNQFGGLNTFLPVAKSSHLSSRLLDLQTPELTRRVLGDDWRFWDTHGEKLAAQVLEIRTNLISELEKNYQARKSKRRAKRPIQEVEIDSEDDLGNESEDLDASQPCRTSLNPRRMVFSIPGSKRSRIEAEIRERDRDK